MNAKELKRLIEIAEDNTREMLNVCLNSSWRKTDEITALTDELAFVKALREQHE